MKYLRVYLSLLFALVMSLILSSVVVYADEVDASTFKLNLYGWENTIGSAQVNLNNGDPGFNMWSKDVTWVNQTYTWTQRYTFADTTNAAMFEAGRNYTFTANNLYLEMSYIKSNGSKKQVFGDAFRVTSNGSVELVYMDGSREYFNSGRITFNPANDTFSLSATFKPSKDVYRIIFYTSYSENPVSSDSALLGKTTQNYFYFGTPADSVFTLDIQVESEEVGLLGGILGKLGDVWDAITNGFNNMIQSITELPQRIWSFIENGLKSLFVPSEDDMAAYSDKWDSLLADRFGAVYQVTNVLTDSWDAVMAADQTNTIDFPEATINFGDGVQFSFGGYPVQIVPDGFEVLVNAVKLIIGIVASIAFVNGMRRKYDEVMGVET